MEYYRSPKKSLVSLNKNLTSMKRSKGIKRNIVVRTMLGRTCCRSFDPSKKVGREEIKTILKVGQAAPSAKNRQPWYFLVIENQQVKDEIAKAAFLGRQKQFAGWDKKAAQKMINGNGFNSSNDKVIAEAPCIIVVMRNSDSSYSEALPDELNMKEEQGVACATYSMMLAAWALGLGSVWICSVLYIRDELRIILENAGINWNDNWQPRAILPIGYPKANPKKPPRELISGVSKFIR